MYYGGSYGLYKNAAYTFSTNLNSNYVFGKDEKVFENSRVVAFEVPEDSAGFTVYAETLAGKTTMYILGNGGVKLVEYFNTIFSKELDKLYELSRRLCKIDFNIMGYLVRKTEKDPDAKEGIFFYDMYINENWVNYCDLKKILAKIELNSLPIVYDGVYNKKALKELLGVPSIYYMNDNKTVQNMIVKTYREPYGDTTRYGTAFFYDVPEYPPLTNQTTSKDTAKKEEEELPVVPELPAPDTNPSDVKEENKNVSDKEKETITRIQKEAEQKRLAKEKEENEFNTVKNYFDLWIDTRVLVQDLEAVGIKVEKANAKLIFSFIKAKFMEYLFSGWGSWDGLNEIDTPIIEKNVSKLAVVVCKDKLNLFGTVQGGTIND